MGLREGQEVVRLSPAPGPPTPRPPNAHGRESCGRDDPNQSHRRAAWLGLLRLMRVRLWSWNYTPEPTGMAPVAAAWSRAMAIRGHQVDVISAFPHYPSTLFRQRARPYRETIDGIAVTRLPLVIGHATPARRMLEETTYALSAAVASVSLRRVDVEVVVSPSFLALAVAASKRGLCGQAWVLWLQDLLPDAAATTG